MTVCHSPSFNFTQHTHGDKQLIKCVLDSDLDKYKRADETLHIIAHRKPLFLVFETFLLVITSP